jgi:hypothetical protein
LEEHDGLAVGDAAVADHHESVGEGQFEDFDVLALLLQAATLPRAIGRGVGGGVEVQAIGDRPGTPVGVEDANEFTQPDAEFLAGICVTSRPRPHGTYPRTSA